MSARSILGIGVALLLVAAGAAYVRFGRSHAPPTADPPQPIPVIARKVEQRDVPIVLTGLGAVTPLNTATVRSPGHGPDHERRLSGGSVCQEG
jgi:membrane fusion protein, multidrug efflux system